MKTACLSIFLLVFLIAESSFNSAAPGYQLIGVWESEEKDLQIEMFEKDGEFFGRMIYFKCTTDEIMRTIKDIENPDTDLTKRNLLGLMLVTDLAYQGDNIWDDGKIYDPNSGRTFEARIQLTGPQSAIVRGYWKYRWIGRSMIFHRKIN
jgi:uncharacterized protein (DUF2147 family)